MDYQELFTYLDNNSELSYPFPDPDTFTMEDLNLVFDKLDSSNASLIISASLGSSTWLSYNESIINYIIDAIKEVNFVEKLTRYNKRDFINEFLIPSFVISFDDLSSIRIELTKTDRLYITYYTHDISNNTRGIKYHFMSEKITNRDFFYHFTFAQPTSDYYYKSEIVDSYIDDSLITKEQQFRIVKTFIADFADLARFYEEGTKFSGHIKKCYGNFGGSAYYPHVAIMVEFSDTTYELQDATDIIDGVEFKYQDSNRIYFYTGNTFTLQEAFDEGYLTHDNLLAIRKAHNLG